MDNLKDVFYDAFISYRHLELDSYIAQSIHKKLEGFKLPRSVKKKTGTSKTKINRVFRDTEELPLSDNLSDPINQALANSEFLICICTKKYHESLWCMREIEVFLQTHERDHILVVLAEGEPDESFPEILTYEETEITDENGKTHTTRREIEPLAADTRGNDKKEIIKKMDTAVLRLCAAIFNLNYDDLRQRHREAKLKRIIALSGVIGACLLAVTVFATVTMVRISNQNSEISRQNREINAQNAKISTQYIELQDRYAGQMAVAAESLMKSGRWRDAVYALRKVLPDDETEPYNSDALGMLYRAMNVYGIEDRYFPVVTYDTDSEVQMYEISPDGKKLLITEPLRVLIFDTKTGELITKFEKDYSKESNSYEGHFCGSDAVVILDDEMCGYHLIDSLDAIEEKELPGLPIYTVFNNVPDGWGTIAYSDDTVYGIESSGDCKYKIDLGEQFKTEGMELLSLTIDKDRFFAVLTDHESLQLMVADIKTGNIILRKTEKNKGDSIGLIDGDKIYYIVSTADSNSDDLKTSACAVDIGTGRKVWETKLADYFTGSICIADNDLFITDKAGVIVLDPQTGKHIQTAYSEGVVTSAWVMNNQFFYTTDDGSLRAYSDEMSYDATDTYFWFKPAENITDVRCVGDSLYYFYDMTGYIVKQYLENAEYVEKTEYEAPDDYQMSDGQTGDLMEELVEKADVDGALIENAILSDDEKLILVTFNNDTVQIIDASTYKSLVTLNWNMKGQWLQKFRYSELTGSYILETMINSYIFDKNYHVICETNRIEEDEADGFIMSGSDYEYYHVPYVSYNELIRRADALISGYMPDEAIRKKYNFS